MPTLVAWRMVLGQGLSLTLVVVCGKSESARHEIVYFAESTVGAVRLNDYKYRFIDQPQDWLGSTVKPDWPILVYLRLDPFECTGLSGSLDFIEWYQYEFWRFVLVQDVMERFAKSFVDYPPTQEGATFNLDASNACRRSWCHSRFHVSGRQLALVVASQCSAFENISRLRQSAAGRRLLRVRSQRQLLPGPL